MNNARRQTLESLQRRVMELQDQINDIVSEIESARDDEQDYRDNMPESFADGEKGQKADEAIDALEEAISALQDIDCSAMADTLTRAAE